MPKGNLCSTHKDSGEEFLTKLPFSDSNISLFKPRLSHAVND